MISLDQVILLEQKIESAVEKIQQLQAENDALRKKCSELTNALSSKSEQLTSFETDQSQIESGILKALDRLNQIENSVLKVAGQAASTPVVNIQQTAEPVKMQAQPAQVNPASTTNATPAPGTEEKAPVQTQTQFSAPIQNSNPVHTQPQGLNSQFIQTSSQNNFFTMNEVPSQSPDADFSEPEMETEEENSDNLGFDIF